MQPRKALGKGLASLIPAEKEGPATINIETTGALEIDIDSIVPNRLQPRKNFNEETLNELAASIGENGIIQPLVVSPEVSGRYELIAGERRLRAARLAGLERVPVIIKEADPELMLELAIIENIQREDLNAIEEATAYKELMEEFEYTQEEIAKKLSKSRPHISNTLRLLHLPKIIQEDVAIGRLSPGHARALLAVADLQEQLKLRETILQSRLTVRDVEKIIQQSLRTATRKTTGKKIELSPQLKAVKEELTKSLGTKVAIKPYKNNKGGQITLEYYSVQDLNRIYRHIAAT